MDLKERLEKAISAGEVLEIKYFGGSTPGRLRKVAPIRIEGEKLVARCLRTDVAKQFLLSKISFSDGENQFDVSKNVLRQLELETMSNLEQLVDKYGSYFKDLGWYVDFRGSNFLGLNPYFKNGKPRKSSVISICYDEYSEQEIYDFEKENFIIERVKKQKPWSVRAKGHTTRSYSNLSKGIETFMEFAEMLSLDKM